MFKATSENKQTKNTLYETLPEKKELTLTDQETDTDTRQVETVQPILNIVTYMTGILAPFPLQDTLRNSCYSGVMATLDVIK